MSRWKYISYISIVVVVLLGGALSFGGWALSQFEIAFRDIDISYSQLGASVAANVKLVPDDTVATTTGAVATTTGAVEEVATTTPDIKITSPAKGDDIYIGCSYKISWQPTTTIKALDIALVDSGTQKPAGPIISGLSATSTEVGFKDLDWKVGNVWPGEYYILISKTNGQEVQKRSGMFTVSNIPNGKDRKDFCDF